MTKFPTQTGNRLSKVTRQIGTEMFDDTTIVNRLPFGITTAIEPVMFNRFTRDLNRHINHKCCVIKRTHTLTFSEYVNNPPNKDIQPKPRVIQISTQA